MIDWVALTLLVPIIIGALVFLGAAMWGPIRSVSTFDKPEPTMLSGGYFAAVLVVVFGLAFCAASAMATLVTLHQIPTETNARRTADRIAWGLFAFGMFGIALFVVCALREPAMPITCSIVLMLGSFQSLVPALLRYRADTRAARGRRDHFRDTEPSAG